MHLLFENVVQNLVMLWMGKFKGLDNGTGDFIIPKAIWIKIGDETVAAMKEIPAAFVRLLGNLAEDRTTYTAEGWGFWFMYIGPALLKGRLSDKYYKHYILLVDIMKTCIQFTISQDQLKTLGADIVTWVTGYERLYYQYDVERLSTCTLTIHGLLHIPDNIKFCGPVWTTWTFWMERYCGYLRSGSLSRTHPWANLANRILHKAYLEQIDLYYGLEDDLTITSKRLTSKAQFSGYPLSILRPPCQRTFQPDEKLRDKIARYFKEVLGSGSKSDYKAALSRVMPMWGKVKIANGGDAIRTSSASHNPDKERNMSFVRYEVEVSKSNNESARVIFYGELIYILECKLGGQHIWKTFRNQTRLLAVIKPCLTKNRDATKTLVEYEDYTTPIVTDLQVIQCVVGRVPRGSKWAIIDRSGDQVRTEFIDHDASGFYDSDHDDMYTSS